MIYRKLLRSIGIVYGIFGLFSFFMFLFYLAILIIRPMVNKWPAINFVLSLLFPMGLWLMLAIIHFFIVYSFWKLKKWGRYLVFIYNIPWLGAGIYALIKSSTAEHVDPVFGTFVSVIFINVIFFGVITLICLKKEVKELMIN